ncbi:hypothetical protein DXG01_014344 [Tephrocybe rancida]|nr:hypothetical protein DXG01_014344 [Tephrocybe rancida]
MPSKFAGPLRTKLTQTLPRKFSSRSRQIPHPITCTSLFGCQQGSPGILHHACPSTPKLALAIRGYAAATAQKPKATPAAKAGAPQPQKKKGVAPAAVPLKVPEKNKEPVSEEEQMEQLERVMNMSKFFPTADPWGQRVETLDVMIPYSTHPIHRNQYPTWRAIYNQIKTNSLNSAKNCVSLLMLAQENAIPGLDVSRARWWNTFIIEWPWRLAGTTSVKAGAWTGG